jgi:molybdopterin synthase sulfur carrier subunit
MAITIRIPSLMRSLAGGSDTAQATGNTLAEVLGDLVAQFPSLGACLRDDEGRLRRYVNLYLNDVDSRFLQGQDTVVKDGDEVAILPAIAGG